MTGVSYPVADRGGELVWAEDLRALGDRPDDLTCCGCAEPLRLKAGSVNRPHFAHHDGKECHGGPETALHRTTIRVLADALMAAASAGLPFPIFEACATCEAQREGDLARAGTLTVELERALEDGMRPDLTALDSSDRLLYVIEVVVTHTPEHAALELYRRLNLPVVLVWPTWETLGRIRRGLTKDLHRCARTTTGSFALACCRFPRHRQDERESAACHCGLDTVRIDSETSTMQCYRCEGSFPVLDLYVLDAGRRRLIAASAAELRGVREIGRAGGVKLERAKSGMAGGSYLMHMCTHCGSKQGDNFIYAVDDATTGTDQPVTLYQVCAAGHWQQLAAIPWPSASEARRRTTTEGLVGERGRVFSTPAAAASDTEDLVTLTRVADTNIRTITRRMLGL